MGIAMRGLYDLVFGGRRRDTETLNTYFKTLSGYNPVFSSFGGGLYEASITRAAIHAVATACSKLKPECNGSAAKRYEHMLCYQPNPWMDTTKFIYRIATALAVDNTAIIAPMYDRRDMETIIGFYPVVPSMAEIVERDGNAWVKFTFANGEKSAIELSKVGILTQMQYKRDFFGESNNALLPILQLLHVQNEGIENGIKSSAAIRFLAKLASPLKPKDQAAERARFVAENLSAENNGGVMMYDTKYADVKQIDSKPYIIDAEQMRLINSNVYSYFGVNEDIMQNKWMSSLTWQAFYEGKISPFATQLGLVMTNMIFSRREVAAGNEIMFSSNRLQYASNEEKLNTVTNLFDRGIFSLNQCLDVFNMPHVEGGDDRYIRGEYVNMNDRKETINNADKNGQGIPIDDDVGVTGSGSAEAD